MFFSLYYFHIYNSKPHQLEFSVAKPCTDQNELFDALDAAVANRFMIISALSLFFFHLLYIPFAFV